MASFDHTVYRDALSRFGDVQTVTVTQQAMSEKTNSTKRKTTKSPNKGEWTNVDTTGLDAKQKAELAESLVRPASKRTRASNKVKPEQEKVGQIARAMESYHYAWLSAHPERSEEWLSNILVQGFHIHHMDGDHHNDDPKNLVLIEAGDHMMIHNGVARLLWKPKLAPKQKEKKPTKKSLQKAIAQLEVKLEEVKNQQQAETTIISKADTKVFVDAFLNPITPPPKLPREITASQRKEISDFHKLMKMRVGV